MKTVSLLRSTLVFMCRVACVVSIRLACLTMISSNRFCHSTSLTHYFCSAVCARTSFAHFLAHSSRSPCSSSGRPYTLHPFTICAYRNQIMQCINVPLPVNIIPYTSRSFATLFTSTLTFCLGFVHPKYSVFHTLDEKLFPSIANGYIYTITPEHRLPNTFSTIQLLSFILCHIPWEAFNKTMFQHILPSPIIHSEHLFLTFSSLQPGRCKLLDSILNSRLSLFSPVLTPSLRYRYINAFQEHIRSFFGCVCKLIHNEFYRSNSYDRQIIPVLQCGEQKHAIKIKCVCWNDSEHDMYSGAIFLSLCRLECGLEWVYDRRFHSTSNHPSFCMHEFVCLDIALISLFMKFNTIFAACFKLMWMRLLFHVVCFSTENYTLRMFCACQMLFTRKKAY